jgi:uncharacterized protein YggE
MVAQPLVISVSGTATRSATPDRAKVTLVAEGTGTSIAQAIRAHAAEVQRVVQAAIACGAEEQNIHGAAPRIIEENEPGLPNAEQRSITASRVAGNIIVTLDDLTLLAQVVDGALGAGAAFGGIVFTFKAEAQVRHAVLTAAMLDAEISGASLAATLGKQLGGVLGVAEENVAFDGISEYTARVRVSFVLANVQPLQGPAG